MGYRKAPPQDESQLTRFVCARCSKQSVMVAFQAVLIAMTGLVLGTLWTLHQRMADDGAACRDQVLDRYAGTGEARRCPHPQHTLQLGGNQDWVCFCDSLAGAAVRGTMFQEREQE